MRSVNKEVRFAQATGSLWVERYDLGFAKCFEMMFFSTLFGILLWLIYALNYILKGNFDIDFLPVISFIKIFVAEKVARSLAG